MKSLAEHLGVIDPRKPDAPAKPTTPRQVIKDFCRDILASDEYRASLLRRIFIDELPPAVEVLLYHYAHGKPVEKLEVREGPLEIETLTAEQCETRALFLVEYARKLREHEQSDDEEPSGPSPPTIN